MESFNLTKPVQIVNASANVDVLYGTFNSLAEACVNVPSVLRLIGRTVGIIESGAVVDYYWKAGIEDSDLVPKNQETGIYNYETTVVEVTENIETVIKTMVIPANTFKNLDVLDCLVLGTLLTANYGYINIYLTQDAVIDNSKKLMEYSSFPVYYGKSFSFSAKANGILVKNNQLINYGTFDSSTDFSVIIPFNPSLPYNLVVTTSSINTHTTELLTIKKTN